MTQLRTNPDNAALDRLIYTYNQTIAENMQLAFIEACVIYGFEEWQYNDYWEDSNVKVIADAYAKKAQKTS